MSEVSNKNTNKDAARRKTGLGGMIGRKAPPAPEMPPMDVASGVNRALRGSAATFDQGRGEIAESLKTTLATIESALFAVDTIRDILEQALDIAQSALNVSEPGGRALLAESYDEARLALGEAVEKLDAQAAGLIGKAPHNIDVKLGGKAHYSVSAVRLDLSPKGLHLDPPREAFASNDEIERVLSEIDTALQRADRAASAFCRDAQFLISRMPQNQAAE